MIVQTIRDLRRQRPFMPFGVVMSSGQKYEVLRPELAFLTQKEIVVGLDVGDDNAPADFKMCPLHQVTAIEPLTAEPTGAK